MKPCHAMPSCKTSLLLLQDKELNKMAKDCLKSEEISDFDKVWQSCLVTAVFVTALLATVIS